MTPTKFTQEQYEHLLKMLCPYCQYGIPDVRESDKQEWVHSIPGTAVNGPCWAGRIRGKLTIVPAVASAERG